ncbi:MAG: DUF6017 domain-containing protein [Lachnospiraceae bacterium]
MGEMMTFDYYYGLQAEQYSFYRIPKLLFTHEYFKVLSCEAKVLYGLFLDRMSLSIKNKWFDGENRVYIIFAVEEVMELMSCGRQKAVKIMMELDSEKGIGLTEKKRLGLGKANILYVKNFILQEPICSVEKVAVNGENTQKYENQTSGSMKIKLQEVPKSNFQKCENQTSGSMKIELQEVPESSFQKCENQTSGSMKIKLQEVRKSYSNYTDNSNTDYSDTESNHIQSEEILTEKRVDAIDAYREVIHENMEYETLCTQYRKEDIDEIVELILEVVSSKKKTIRISGEEVDVNLVKGRFMKLGYAHMQYVFGCLEKNTTKVTNIKQYLLAVLYNAPATINHYYKAEVQHDLYGG